MYLSDLNLSSEEEAPVQGEPAPDMTGVVDSNFNSKVEQHATTEMQATAADLNKRFGALQGEVDILSKGRAADQVRIEQLSNENAAMQEQLRTLGVRPSVPGGEPAPTLPLRHPGRKVNRNRQIIRHSLVVRYRRRPLSIRVTVLCNPAGQLSVCTGTEPDQP
jgi:conjugal transfer pilus assembly protein TraB